MNNGSGSQLHSFHHGSPIKSTAYVFGVHLCGFVSGISISETVAIVEQLYKILVFDCVLEEREKRKGHVYHKNTVGQT